MDRTLLLNASYEPLRVIPWQKAIIMLCQDKVEVVAFHDREVRGVSITFRLPSVLRLLRYIRIRSSHRTVKFSRANIFARDRNHCQYCGRKEQPEELTFDHVIPVARGGRKTWENIVTACVPCNRRKGGQTPREAGMRLIRPPTRPRWHPTLTVTIGLKHTPESWRDYLYWNMELEADDAG